MNQIRRIGTINDSLGEGTVWCPVERALYWVDIKAPAVRRWTAATDSVQSWAMPENVGSLALCSGADDGRILVALRGSMAVFDPASGNLRTIATAGHADTLRFNDGKCDRQGRFWVGSMGDGARGKHGRLYCLDAGRFTAVLDGIDIPNSLCWSPDGRTMYFADTVEHVIWAFPYDTATGSMGERRVFASTGSEEGPDGATVDAEGYVWSARYHGGRVVRLAPDGHEDRVIELPATNITCCGFGGPDLTTLFITSASQGLDASQLAAQPLAGALFAVDVSVKGLPEARYAG